MQTKTPPTNKINFTLTANQKQIKPTKYNNNPFGRGSMDMIKTFGAELRAILLPTGP